MLKFIKGKGHHTSADRLKVQKELFVFQKTVSHGFPHRPSSLAWDPKLQLFAIGTKTGAIRIYGKPGVEYCGQHESEVQVIQIYFIQNQGRLITLCEDNTLHLWEINNKEDRSVLEKVHSHTVDGKLKKVYTCCVQSSGEHLLVGTEGGNIHLLDIKTFEMTDKIIYQELVTQNVPDDYKVNPGGVEAIVEHPSDPNKFLIGYSRGLMVLWDNKTLNADQTYICNKDLNSVCWLRGGLQFISAHSDSSYFIWSASDSSKPVESVEQCYGPYPCKAIDKILWRSVKNNDNFFIFSGGMPRANYGDKHTVSVKQGDKSEVFDFTSKVVDFFTIDDGDDSEYDNPHTLVVLAEEEIVVIDLLSEGWKPFSLPYLNSLHSSVITCAQHCVGVPDDIWNKIVEAGKEQMAGKNTDREWPVNGGNVLSEIPQHHDLLLTGHEDGTVRFWDVSTTSLKHIYTLKTASLFASADQTQNSLDEEEEWLHFNKVGTFDPYSDDPRLAVKKIAFCLSTGRLVVAGTAGQVVSFTLEAEESEKTPESVSVNFVSDRDSFVWKGHDPLQLKSVAQNYSPGFQPEVLLQLSPPASVTALALHSEWGLIAAGTAHGFGLLDFLQKKIVVSKCTLNPNDLATSGDTMNRRKSFKKSLRESFRRLRKGRSQRQKREKPAKPSEEPSSSKEASTSEAQNESPPPAEAEQPEVATESVPAATSSPTVESKPVERQVEARSTDDAMSSMVRSLCLAKNFILNNVNTSPTLWAGTNAGAIFVFTITLPAEDKRDSESVSCQLGKEIQLKHKAPVIGIYIIDSHGYPLSDPVEAEQPQTSSPQRVLISSEEQFKVFTLPSLKPYGKFKLTASEGSRVRKVGIAQYNSKSDSNYKEYCLSILTNQGDVSIYSLPELRRQLIKNCIKKEDINGISSVVFTKGGEGFYLNSPCEFDRFTMSASQVLEALCTIDLPEGARPAPPAPPANAAPDPSEEATTEKGTHNEESSKEGVAEDSLPDSGVGSLETKNEESTNPPSENEKSPEKEVKDATETVNQMNQALIQTTAEIISEKIIEQKIEETSEIIEAALPNGRQTAKT